jgi:hypothetical protein
MTLRRLGLTLASVLLLACASEPSHSPAAPERASPQAAPIAAVVSDAQARQRLAEADRTFRSRAYAKALPQYQDAAGYAQGVGDRSAEGEALAQVARMFSLTKRLAEGRQWLDRARAVASPLAWTRYLGVRGIFERESKDRAKALDTFTQMYDYALAQHLPRRAIDAAHHAALVAPKDAQIGWAHKGIAAAEAGQEEGWLAVLWNNLGSTHESRKDWSGAAAAYETARRYHHRTGGPTQKLVADWAYGRSSLRAGNVEVARGLLPDCLRRAKAWRQAKPQDAEAREWVGWCQAALGEFEVHEGQVASGLKRLRAGRELLVAAKIESWWPEGLEDLDAVIRRAERGR